MPRPIEALVHQESLAHNIRRVRECVDGAKVFAVVKANAYGHGLENSFEGLRGADGFALLDFDEAKRIRALGWKGPILLLEGCFEAGDLHLCDELGLWHTVHQERQIDWLSDHVSSATQGVFLKLNSGMNRLGFAPGDYRRAWTRLSSLPTVGEPGLMTHFADADGPLGVEHQLEAFQALTADLPGARSLSNSAAVLRHGTNEAVRADWVRAGIMSYGCAPDFPEHDIDHWNLKPTMTLRSKVIAVQQLHEGDTVGYGSSFMALQPMRVGIVACGYADGYPRHAGHGAPVLVGGQPTTTVGRVSMDMMVVDLTELPDEDLGSEVTLWGYGPNGSVLPIDEVAYAANTIGYELMCALAQRVPVTVVRLHG